VSALVLVGISHRTAPVEERERAKLDAAAARELLGALRADPAVPEAAVLSTCNRTEVIAAGADPWAIAPVLGEALVRHTGLSAAELAADGYELAGSRALLHLFRVTASLDSMVVGESEIQHQVRAAWQLATGEGSAGPELTDAFRHALRAGRRVRRRTRIAEGAVSLPSAAVELARRALGDLAGRRALLIGAGHVARSTARALRYRGLREVSVANRTPAAARSLAAGFGGRAVAIDALADELSTADVVISSTEAPHLVVSASQFARATAGEARPVVLIDIAVPRDLDPAIAAFEHATLHDMDDLQRLVDANRRLRRGEAERAERLVEAEARRFLGLGAPGRHRAAALGAPASLI
jgi:glutamyl-tRNA reductase